jgi:hypothetical protein
VLRKYWIPDQRTLLVANSWSVGDRELEQVPAVLLPTVVVQCGGGGAEELREGGQQVDGKDEEFSHRADRCAPQILDPGRTDLVAGPSPGDDMTVA